LKIKEQEKRLTLNEHDDDDNDDDLKSAFCCLTLHNFTMHGTKTGTEIQTGRKKERGTAEGEMEGPTSL
jgi:hypothetical protein